MRGKKADLTGQKFGRLTAIEPAFRDSHNRWHWLCQCECGNTHTADVTSLTRGNTKSCGCLNREMCLTGNNRRTHGMCHTRIHRIWQGMKRRCYNKNTPDYKDYGERGIEVFDEWKNDFQAFYDWAMANGYSEELSIDRIDPDGNYEPSNCRWSSSKVQARNKRNVPLVEYNGETHSLPEWAEITGIERGTLYYRIFISKWDIEKALTKGAC